MLKVQARGNLCHLYLLPFKGTLDLDAPVHAQQLLLLLQTFYYMKLHTGFLQ